MHTVPELDPTATSCRKAHRSRRLRHFIVVGVAAWLGCFWFADSEFDGASGTRQVASGAEVQTKSSSVGMSASRPVAPATETRRVVEKLLPDLRILKGSPSTVIDLSEVFSNTELASGGEFQISVAYDSKKGKVVEAKVVDGRQLVITPRKNGKADIVIEAKNSDGVVHAKFLAQVWEPDYWKLVLTVIGGLGVFLFGMKSLSEGMQAVAGQSLRRMIGAVTNNRLMATGVGTLVTMLVQSSSITTVMVVGFVNSGFMTLTQGIGVIMGANIGTTITGWILTLKIGKYGLPMVGIGAFGYLFSQRDRIRYLSMTLMGLGMVFLGLELMKDGFATVKELPEFEEWFARFNSETYLGVLKCAAVGCMLTFIVQSSSATLGITIGLAQIGVIPFETAAALVMGENIGTTITAWLASFGTTTNARRAAYFHVLFNIIGVLWITALFQYYLSLVRWVMGGDIGSEVATTAAIATTHTLFNVTNTILFLPFVGFFARFLQRVIHDKPDRAAEVPRLTNLDVRILEAPPIVAVEQSRVELLRMAECCKSMMAGLRDVLGQEEPDEDTMKKVLAIEQDLDMMQTEVVDFMSNLLAANVPHEVIDEIRRQLRVADEFESVSDSIATALKAYRKLHRAGLDLPGEEHDNVIELHERVTGFLGDVCDAYRHGEKNVIEKARPEAAAITKHIKQLGHRILDKTLHVGTGERIDPRVSRSYNRQITAYRRIRDHVVNIAEALSGEK